MADSPFDVLGGGTILRLTATTQGVTAGVTGGFPFDLKTNDLSRLRIAANGNVGIGTGTSSISAKLQVAGTTQTETLICSGSVTANTFLGDGSGLTGVLPTLGGTINGSLEITENLNVQGKIETLNLSIKNSNTQPVIQLDTINGAGNIRLWGTDGNLAVQLSENGLSTRSLVVNDLGGNPTLSIAGDGSISSAGSLSVGVTGGFPFDLKTNDLTRLRIDPDGNVGIGTAAPQPVTLEVNGTVKATSYQGDGSGLTNIIGTTQWSNDASNSIYYNGGNVGIGTAAPEARLDIANTGTNMWFRLGDGGDAGRLWVTYGGQLAPLLVMSDLDEPPRIQFQQIGTGTEPAPQFASWIGQARSISSDIAIMNGNVGIGTTLPRDTLDVAGSLRILTGYNPIRFTSGWSGFPDAVTNQAEICNDTGTYKTLMIVGNRSAGLGRRVSIWDRLEVNGRMSVSDGVIQKGGLPVTGTRDLGLYSQESGFWMRFVTTGGNAGFWFFSDGGAGRNVVAQIDANGRYTQYSSRNYKENIENLSSQEAFKALEDLIPVLFSYKQDERKRRHIGFIAEDLPELVADPEQKMLSSTDIIAVLTKVVKEQQDTIATLVEKMRVLEEKFSS